MHFVDAHLHTEGLSVYDLRQMALMGVRTVVTFFKPYYRVSGTDSYVDLIERFIRVEKNRVESTGIKTYLAIGISYAAGIRDPFPLVEKLEDYLKFDFVVAIGEAGLSDFNDALQVEILKIQMELSRKFGKPIFVDLPEGNKKYAFKRVEKLVNEVGLDPSLVVLNEVTPLLVLDLSDKPYWFCFSLFPDRPFVETLPENILRGDFPMDRVLLTSNLDAFTDNPTLLPETLYDLEVGGHYLPMIERLMRDNPARLFKLS